MSLRACLCCVAAGLLMLPAASARADEPGNPRATPKTEAPARTKAAGERSVKQAPTQPDRAAQPRSTAAKPRQVSVGPPLTTAGNAPLTTASLKTWLEDMGYEPQQDGETFIIEVTGWRLFMDVSPDGQWIWIYCGVSRFADASQAPLDKVLALMEWNGAHGHFTYSSQNQIVSFQSPIANSGISKAALRRAIDNAAKMVSSTNPIWDALGWAE